MCLWSICHGPVFKGTEIGKLLFLSQRSLSSSGSTKVRSCLIGKWLPLFLFPISVRPEMVKSKEACTIVLPLSFSFRWWSTFFPLHFSSWTSQLIVSDPGRGASSGWAVRLNALANLPFLLFWESMLFLSASDLHYCCCFFHCGKAYIT